jgi:hypothetical protein
MRPGKAKEICVELLVITLICCVVFWLPIAILFLLKALH